MLCQVYRLVPLWMSGMRSAAVCDALLWIKCCIIVCAAKEEKFGTGAGFHFSPIQNLLHYLKKTECFHLWKKEAWLFLSLIKSVDTEST